MRGELRHAIALTPVLLVTTSVSAQATLSECGHIADREIRLECFDAVAKRAGNVSVGSGYLKQEELYRLGRLITAFFMAVFLVFGAGWLLLVAG